MTEQPVIDLEPENFEIVQAILNEFAPGRPVFIFGSRATGRARRRSDLDLAIGGETPLTLRMRANLHEAFGESDLPIKVDVVDLAHATGIFRERIESEWIPFHVAAKQLGMKAAA